MIKISYILIAFLLIISCGSNAESDSKSKIQEIVDQQPSDYIVVKENDAELDLSEYAEIVVKDEDSNSIDKSILKTKIVVVTAEELLEIKEQARTNELISLVEPTAPNHDDWTSLTKKYVSTSGKVDYKGFKKDLDKVKIYLKQLEKNSPKTDWSKNEKLAYWINLYNASTIYLVASNYPTSSIKKIAGGKPWDKKFVKSGTKVYSLNDIEHKIIRPTFKDPRIHAALNCAAVSCPKLLNVAYTANQLNAQLDKQCKAWVNDVAKNKLYPNKVQISELFNWYATDFKAGGGVVKFISKYSIKKFKIDPKAKISYMKYNWSLNE